MQRIVLKALAYLGMHTSELMKEIISSMLENDC